MKISTRNDKLIIESEKVNVKLNCNLIFVDEIFLRKFY